MAIIPMMMMTNEVMVPMMMNGRMAPSTFATMGMLTEASSHGNDDYDNE